MFNFTGSSRPPRTINLGGSSSIGGGVRGGGFSSDPVIRAKQEREKREQLRRRERAAFRVQSCWRGYWVRKIKREEWRKEWDTNDGLLGDEGLEKVEKVVNRTRLIAFMFEEKRPVESGDLKRLGAWGREMVTEKVKVPNSSSPVPLLFSPFYFSPYPSTSLPSSSSTWKTFKNSTSREEKLAISWIALLGRLGKMMIKMAGEWPKNPQIPLLLEILKQILDPKSYPSSTSLSSPNVTPVITVVERTIKGTDYYGELRKYWNGIEGTKSSSPTSLLTLSILPIRALSPFLSSPSSSTGLSLFSTVKGFISQILTLNPSTTFDRIPESKKVNLLIGEEKEWEVVMGVWWSEANTNTNLSEKEKEKAISEKMDVDGEGGEEKRGLKNTVERIVKGRSLMRGGGTGSEERAYVNLLINVSELGKRKLGEITSTSASGSGNTTTTTSKEERKQRERMVLGGFVDLLRWGWDKVGEMGVITLMGMSDGSLGTIKRGEDDMDVDSGTSSKSKAKGKASDPVPVPPTDLDPTLLSRLIGTTNQSVYLSQLLTFISRYHPNTLYLPLFSLFVSLLHTLPRSHSTSTSPASSSSLAIDATPTAQSSAAAAAAASSGNLGKKERDDLLNDLVWRGSGKMKGGFVREVWREGVRGKGLERKIIGSGEGEIGGGKDATGVVVKALSDPSLANFWPPLVLVSELYSRQLLTLGDDEFYSPRNPLPLAEVVSLAALLRNVAFALYWNESQFTSSSGGGNGMDSEGESEIERRCVSGMTMRLVDLRELATRFLKQIHARDSRRPFAPENFWLMTSEFDLQSFIQTVVFEEEQLDQQLQDSDSSSVNHPPPPPLDLRRPWLARRFLYDEDDDEGSFGGRRGRRRGGAGYSSKPSFTKRQISMFSPRLGILNNLPFVIPFDVRVALFRQFIRNDRRRNNIGSNTAFFTSRKHRAVIRRDHVAEDGYAHLGSLGKNLKEPVQITFIDQWGQEEAGIDGGGVFKEFLTSLSKEAFDTNHGLWLSNKNHELYPNPHSYARDASQLSWYQFIGRVLGKALYEGILVDVSFADFFLAKWLGKQSYLDDLASLDPELYRGLIYLKEYDGDVEKDLSLDFTITDSEFGQSVAHELIPQGSKIPVTNQNRMKYILLTSHYRLNLQIEKQCAAFFSGLSDIIDPKWLRMFNQSELRIMAGGAEEPIDIDDLRRNTVYAGFDEADDAIRWFWQAVEGFDQAERKALLKFVTSCSRPPLLGFKELNPSFALRDAGPAGDGRLPSASTCVNMCKLPRYTSAIQLKQKLLYAINAAAGFDLS